MRNLSMAARAQFQNASKFKGNEEIRDIFRTNYQSLALVCDHYTVTPKRIHNGILWNQLCH